MDHRRRLARATAFALVAVTVVDAALLWSARPALQAGRPGNRYVVNMERLGEVLYVNLPSISARHAVTLTGISCPGTAAVRCSGAVFEPGAQRVQIAVADDAELRLRHLPLPRALPLRISGAGDPKHQPVVVLEGVRSGFLELRSLTVTYVDSGRQRSLRLPCKYDIHIPP